MQTNIKNSESMLKDVWETNVKSFVGRPTEKSKAKRAWKDVFQTLKDHNC